jgi:hypothetical protein
MYRYGGGKRERSMIVLVGLSEGTTGRQERKENDKRE